MTKIHRWGKFEFSLKSEKIYENPIDINVKVVLTDRNNKTQTINAFWYGENEWRFRFSPDQLGEWNWKTVCDDAENSRLHDQIGKFECTDYDGENPIYKHGRIKLSDDKRSFVHDDGTPFFWLACTAWNGVLRADPDDWKKYLAKRRDQKFTAIQFVTTHWRGGTEVLPDRSFYINGPLKINPDFFKRIDSLVAEINAHGLIASPIVLWALTESDPGRALSIENAIKLARYIVARYGGDQVIWMLGGDGHYYGEHVDRWRKIGRGVFGDRHDFLVTLHPCGLRWVANEYADEDWFDFVGYQSGHGAEDRSLKFLVADQITSQWKQLNFPIVNLEPNYEAHPAYRSGMVFTDYHVRRAAYWSLLIAPTAGVTYGHNAIWVWNDVTADAENHANLRNIPPWHTSVETHGTESMTIMRDFFRSGEWWKLRPSQELLIDQPGGDDLNRFIAVARTTDQKWTVIYTPIGEDLRLNLEGSHDAKWFDPRNGKRKTLGSLDPSRITFKAPSDQDWILELKKID